jgi:hypothetical protein
VEHEVAAMTDAPRVSREQLSLHELRELHAELGALPFTSTESMPHRARIAVAELLALRTPNEHGSALAQEAGERKLTRDEWRAVDRAFWASVNDASPAVSEPAEPVSKSVAKRIAAQKGEPYPFQAEPVFTTDFQDTGAPLSDLVHRKPAAATGLTREEVEAMEAAIHQLEELADATEFSGQYKQDPARKHITTLRNLAARK